MSFTEKIEKALLDAGWFQGREIDISKYEDILTSEGYPLYEKTKKLLKEFGGLVVTHDAYVVPDETDSFHLDPITAADNVMRKIINKYEKRIGKSVGCVTERGCLYI